MRIATIKPEKVWRVGKEIFASYADARVGMKRVAEKQIADDLEAVLDGSVNWEGFTGGVWEIVNAILDNFDVKRKRVR